jgi:MFS family permease
VAAPLGARLYDGIGTRAPVSAGALLIAAGLASIAALLTQQRYALIVPGYVAIGIGLGLTISPSTTDALSAAPPPRRGQAAGLVQTLRQVGGTVGIAVLGAIVAHLLAGGSGPPRIAPAETPAEREKVHPPAAARSAPPGSTPAATAAA